MLSVGVVGLDLRIEWASGGSWGYKKRKLWRRAERMEEVVDFEMKLGAKV